MAYGLQNIQHVPLFQGLESQQSLELYEICGRKEYPANAIILEENRRGDLLFVIVDGRVRVTKTINEQVRELATLEKGDCFGEMALLEKTTRSATVTALEPTTLLEFRIDDLEGLFGKKPLIGCKVYQNLAKILSQRLRNFQKK